MIAVLAFSAAPSPKKKQKTMNASSAPRCQSVSKETPLSIIQKLRKKKLEARSKGGAKFRSLEAVI